VLAALLVPRSEGTHVNPYEAMSDAEIAASIEPPSLPTCGLHVYEAMKLGDQAEMKCVHGEFVRDGIVRAGTFAIATYGTTEQWERYAIVGWDGQLILPLTDRPKLR
jgi:hypothetical protein